MFESAELGHKVDKQAYKEEEPKLREALLNAQYDLHENGSFAVLLIISGPEGAGRSEMVNVLKEWLDPRHLVIQAFGKRSDEERERPMPWRYWRALPPKGRIGILFNGWYGEAFVQRILGNSSAAEFERQLAGIMHHEDMLAHERVLILKFWMHLSKKDFQARHKELSKRPETRWRVTKEDKATYRRYDDLREVAELGLRETSTAHAPWIVVEGLDERYRNLTVGTILLNALRDRLAQKKSRAAPQVTAPLIDRHGGPNLLESLDLTKTLAREEYKTELAKWQARLGTLTRAPKFGKIALVAVFEGNDAAGKGGAIRRITSALDARAYNVYPIAAPTDEERAQPYLWRFWRHVPRRRGIAIFDRSWYGRVLVERVESFCSVDDWMRAFGEINDFEERLAAFGIVVAKFWLSISKDEQERRFRERERTPFKRFKITKEDWRNRMKWDQYVDAVCDMVDRTSTECAPWTLVEANDKLYARVKVLKTLCERIEAAL
ncbi:MAG: polyphosphate:AMP phosphotransferase [Burkholderiales bacterium]|nr:polyphosphate:AMP phosphotransferase [Burkholderiales bacterium]